MIPVHLSPFANHLWQSTLFAGVAALLALALRKNRAQMRYWLWLAASVKFLIPFSLLVSAGSLFEWRGAPAIAPPLSSTIEHVSQPFTLPPMTATPAEPAASSGTPALLVAVWLGGCAVVLSLWCARWLRVRAALRSAASLPIQAPLKVMSSPTLLEPGVFGIFRPVLLLPEGIANRLTPAQFKAVLAHELCHVRRRDNLAAAVHMVVEAIFWFHPLVWWIGARMVEERERACDEEVLRMGNEPQEYAAGILNVCKFYLESPLACVSGVTGADLKKRIEAIMTGHISLKLNVARKLLLAVAATTAVAGPVLIGIVNAPHGRAQSKTEALTFEVASVKPADPDARNTSMQLVPGGGLKIVNAHLKGIIAFAYDVHNNSQISGGPGWIESERFDILAKPPEAAESNTDVRQMTADQRKLLQERIRERLRALLAERFQLTIHRETKELPVYALVAAKNGPKLKESTGDGSQMLRGTRGELTAERVTMQMFVNNLSRSVGRPVLDKTGLKGTYDFKLEYAPDSGGAPGKGGPSEGPAPASSPELSGPSIFTALQAQLGLRLESQKGPVEIIVIDRVEKPSAN